MKKKSKKISFFKRKDFQKKYNLKKTFSRKMSMKASKLIGNWKFVLFQAFVIVLWIIFDLIFFKNGWGSPYLIVLNLMLSVIAAFSAPIILMSQNIEAEKDRLRAINDYLTDRKSEKGIQELQTLVKRMDRRMSKFIKENKKRDS